MRKKDILKTPPHHHKNLHIFSMTEQPHYHHHHRMSIEDPPEISFSPDSKMNRKYSLGTNTLSDSESPSQILSDNLKKYIEIAMKEYRGIRDVINPDQKAK